MPSDNCTVQINQTGVVAMRFIAADLPQDEEPTENEIETLRTIVSELQSEIESSEVFSKSVREWLLDLVRVIRDSIDRFAIRGSRGMRKQFSLLLGELIQNYDLAQKVQSQKPTVWQRFMAAIDVMNKLASLAEHCRPAVTFTQKCLPLLKTLGLPVARRSSGGRQALITQTRCNHDVHWRTAWRVYKWKIKSPSPVTSAVSWQETTV